MVLYGNQLVYPLDIDENEIYWKSTAESAFTFTFCHHFFYAQPLLTCGGGDKGIETPCRQLYHMKIFCPFIHERNGQMPKKLFDKKESKKVDEEQKSNGLVVYPSFR